MKSVQGPWPQPMPPLLRLCTEGRTSGRTSGLIGILCFYYYRFLSLISLILSSMWSLLFPMLSSLLLISSTEWFIPRISVWFFFKVLISLAKWFVFWVNQVTCLSFLSSHWEFSERQSWILSFISRISMYSSWLSGDFFIIIFFLNCLTKLVIRAIWRAGQLCSDTSLADFYEEVFLLFSSRWHWITSFLVLRSSQADLCLCLQCGCKVGGEVCSSLSVFPSDIHRATPTASQPGISHGDI